MQRGLPCEERAPMTAALREGRQPVATSGSRIARAVLWLAMLATLLGMTASPSMAADERVSRFVWDDISTTVRLLDDGTVRVREHDTVQFTGGPFRQGYREIPLAYIESISQVTVTEVGSGPARPYTYKRPGAYSRNSPDTYTFQRVGTTMRIDWSFPPTTSRKRSFVIEYVATGVVQVYAGADPPYQELAWIGVDRVLTRDAPVNTAMLIFILPRPVDPAATFARGNGTLFQGDDGQVWYWRAQNLSMGESLEGTLRFPPLVAVNKPAWQDTRSRQIMRDAQVNLTLLGIALLTAVGGGVGLLAAWWTRGRDPAPGPIPDLLSAPPDATPPGVVGALLDERVDQRDYVATLIDLGRRGVVRMTSVVQPEVSGQRRVAVTLLEPDAPLAPFERELLLTLFANSWWREAQVQLPFTSRAGTRAALERVESLLYTELVQRGYFATRPPRIRAGWRFGSVALWLAAAGVFLLAGSPFTATWALLASLALVAFGAVVYVVAQHMPQKTRAGAEAAARWQAFRRYMAAVDLIGARSSAPGDFERNLPYAVALGLERPWISAFAQTETASPPWYETVNLDGAWTRSAGQAGPRIPLPGTDIDGLQGVNSLGTSSLQSSSGVLFDLFNEVSVAFTPEKVVRSRNLSSSDIGMRIAFSVLKAAVGGRGSGGGGGGFS